MPSWLAICVVLGIQMLASSCGRIGFDPQAQAIDASVPGESWLAPDWQFRQALTIPPSFIQERLTDFPVHVDLAKLGSGFWSEVQDKGGDIRVTARDGVTELPLELVSIDVPARTGQLHFKADDLLSSEDSVFYIYYSNQAASGRSDDDRLGAQAVWSNGYVGVYHLEEQPDTDGGCGTNKACNAVSDQHAGDIRANLTVDQQVPGHVGGCLSFDGSQDFVDVPSLSQTNFPQLQGTLSILFRLDCDVDSPNDAQLFDRYDPNRAHFFMRCSQNLANRNFQMAATVGIQEYIFGESVLVSNTSWNQVTVRYDTEDERMAFFLNGELVDRERSIPNWVPRGQVFVLGGTTNASPIGEVDETRMANVTRTDAWIFAEFSNLSDSSDFYSIAAPQTQTDL